MTAPLESLSDRELDAMLQIRLFGKPEVCRLVGAGTVNDIKRLEPDAYAAYRERGEADDHWERWSPDGATRVVNSFIPEYSGSWAGAGLVVERMWGRDFLFQCENDGEMSGVTRWWTVKFGAWKTDGPYIEATALTFPRAVALAALKALGAAEEA